MSMSIQHANLTSKLKNVGTISEAGNPNLYAQWMDKPLHVAEQNSCYQAQPPIDQPVNDLLANPTFGYTGSM